MTDAAPGAVVGQRYRLVGPLGSGGFGSVWRARDRFAEREVALKLVMDPTGSPVAQRSDFRREAAALRLLRLPGVARLLDEGVHEGQPYLVMDLVAGRRFPGHEAHRAPTPWPELEPLAVRLLWALSGIHARGLVHRDLKPANVLVDDEGRVTVVDLGLAVSRALGVVDERFADSRGTPEYAAPEQLRGDPLDARTDLFAVGVMLFEALVGRNPDGADRGAIVHGRLQGEALAIGECVDAATALSQAGASLIDDLLRRDPDERPSSAREALRRLAGAERTPADRLPWVGLDDPPHALRAATRASRGEDAGGPLGIDELREVFDVPERLHHLPSDAADALFERTGGDPLDVALELDAWEERGLATWTGRGFAVSRRTLDLLPLQPDVATSVEREGEPRSTIDAALDRARDAAERGRLGLSETFFGEALLIARATDRAELDILEAWTVATIRSLSSEALDRVLYELTPYRPLARAERLARLAEACLGVLRSDADRAVAGLRALAPFDEPSLERARLALRLLAARRLSFDAEREALDDLRAWADARDDREADATVHEAEGLQHYRASRFAAAFESHVRAAASYGSRPGRLSALLNAGSAALEGGLLGAAVEAAREALVLATECRSAALEAKAEWLLRAARYRRGETPTPDVELVRAARTLGQPSIEALLYLLEGTLAWRHGRYELARRLLGEAAELWREIGYAPGRALATLTATLAGAPLPSTGPDRRDALVEVARTVTDVGLRAQLFVLLGATGTVDAAALDEARAFAREAGGGEMVRLDVLGLEELEVGRVEVREDSGRLGGDEGGRSRGPRS